MKTPPAKAEQPPAFQPERPRRELAVVLRRRRTLRAGIVQMLAVAIAVALAFVAPRVGAGFDISTNRAIEMLVAVGAGTVTFIGIVFSLLFLVVQFGSTTFTPRLNLFRDAQIVWRAFALYTAVITYSFTAAIVIGQDEKTTAVVPIVAFVGVLVSLILYRRLQMAAFKSIQLASTLAQVARRGRKVIDGLYTQPARPTNAMDTASRAQGPATVGDGRHEIRWPEHSAVLQVIDVPRLLRAVERAGTDIELVVGAGQTLSEGAVIAHVSGRAAPELDDQVLQALTSGEERTFEQDPELSLRVLADIALRALSPAVNDPTTAVQAIDALDGLLRVLAARDLDIGQVAARDGTMRVSLVLPTWQDYLAVALEDVTSLPVLAPTVSRRIQRLLDDLSAITTPDREPALEMYRRKLLGEDEQGPSARPR